MSVKVYDFTPKVKVDTNHRVSIFLRLFLDSITKYSDPITPKKEGPLRQSTIKSVLGRQAKIEWVKEYAAPQERGHRGGIPFVNYTTPGTGKEYAKRGVEKALKNVRTPMKRAGLI